jgi:LmbE family N-acetylglucosaminyl deacetylase
MAVLGVREHRVLGLPDGALAEHGQTGRSLVGQLVDEVRPDTILTFGPDGRTFHPDHLAVHHWVTRAWAERGSPGRLLYAAVTTRALDRFLSLEEELGVYMSDERPVGVAPSELAVHVVLESQPLDQKLAALRAMATQTRGAMAALSADTYAASVAEEAFVAAPVPSEPLAGGVGASPPTRLVRMG